MGRYKQDNIETWIGFAWAALCLVGCFTTFYIIASITATASVAYVVVKLADYLPKDAGIIHVPWAIAASITILPAAVAGLFLFNVTWPRMLSNIHLPVANPDQVTTPTSNSDTKKTSPMTISSDFATALTQRGVRPCDPAGVALAFNIVADNSEFQNELASNGQPWQFVVGELVRLGWRAS